MELVARTVALQQRRNPVGVDAFIESDAPGLSRTPTLGFEPESRWDSAYCIWIPNDNNSKLRPDADAMALTTFSVFDSLFVLTFHLVCFETRYGKSTMNPQSQIQSVPGATEPTPERIFQFAFGYAPPIILEAALEFRVFDHLVPGPLGLDKLVLLTGASRRGLRSLLDALVLLEFLRNTPHRA